MKIIRLNVARQASKEDFQGNTEEYFLEDYSRAELRTDKNILRGELYTQAYTSDVDGNLVRVSDKFICRQQLPANKPVKNKKLYWWREPQVQVKFARGVFVEDYANAKIKTFDKALNSLLWEGNSYTEWFVILTNQFLERTKNRIIQGILNKKKFLVIEVNQKGKMVSKMTIDSLNCEGWDLFLSKMEDKKYERKAYVRECRRKEYEGRLQELGVEMPNDIEKKMNSIVKNLMDEISYWYDIAIPENETLLDYSMRTATLTWYIKNFIPFSRMANEGNLEDHPLPKCAIIEGKKYCLALLHRTGPVEVLIGKSEILDSSL